MEIAIKLYLKIYIFVIYIFINISDDISYNTNFSSNLAVLPLKLFYEQYKSNEDDFSSYDFLDVIHSSKPYLEIEVGNDIKTSFDNKILEEEERKIDDNKQILTIFLSIDDYNFYIDDNYFSDKKKNLICRYSSQLSTSYEINENLKSNYKNSIYGTDYFKIYSDIALDKFNMIKMLFRHSLASNKNISFSCGKAGLLYLSEKQDNYSVANFIHQFHSNLENIDYSFMFDFNQSQNLEKNYDGLFIIGAESYIKNKGNYDLYSFYSTTKNTMNKQEWRFRGDKLIIGNRNYNLDDAGFVIKADIEGIEFSYYFYELLKDDIFNDYYEKKICEEDLIYEYYVIIYCYSDKFTTSDINNFPRIQFTKKEIGFNLSFSGEELFFKKGNKYFFKIISSYETQRQEIKLGRIFLKKTNVIFNSDSKTITFFRINNDKSSNSSIENTKNNGTFLILSYIFISIIFLFIGLYFGRKLCIMRRKKFANELEDSDYEYEPKTNNDKKRALVDL